MDNNRLNIIRFIPGVAMLVFLAGCSGIQYPAIQAELEACPQQTAVAIAAEQNQLSFLTDSHTLACAINTLQKSHDSAIQRTALGSRLCLTLAEREPNQDKREKFAAEGVNFAEIALEQGGQGNGAVHYYLAANLGLKVREHITLAMGSLDRLENEMKQAVALSPDIDDGGPLRLLGALYLKAPAWPKGVGDLDKALELLKKAVDQYPNHPLNHLFYAQALWEEGDETSLSQAKAEFSLGEKLLAEGDWGYNKRPWSTEFNEFAQEHAEIASSVK